MRSRLFGFCTKSFLVAETGTGFFAHNLFCLSLRLSFPAQLAASVREHFAAIQPRDTIEAVAIRK